MLYPSNLEQKLGFDKIRILLSELCVSPLGRSFVQKIRFTDNFEQVQKMIQQTAEMKQLLQFDSPFPSQNFFDVGRHLDKAAIEGAYLLEEELYELKLSLATIQACIAYFLNKEDIQYPFLTALCKMTLPDESDKNTTKLNKPFELKALMGLIDSKIDERGKIRDNASEELSKIRKSLNGLENELRKKLDGILRNVRSNGWISDDFSMTVRNGRLVIPIAAEHKRKIKGFVHDETESGKTVFIEPAEILDLNNNLKELEAAERRELIKILAELSSKVRPYVPELKRAYNFLGIMDFIRAKAQFAINTKSEMPFTSNLPIVNWRKARHPLLYMSFEKTGKTVIPLNLQMPENQHVLVVSGPNAGGKSVMLKTIGLTQYMYQCGMLVHMAEDSTMGIFKNIFIDIGDEQSLENDLSTYSSHLTNMRYFLENANNKTMYLIDEFGTGTEPSLGGAIAESILQDLVKSKAFGVINTHFTNLKAYADKTHGIINGAMRFDAAHLEPMFELEVGQPGSSFALEIANKIGLPQTVIANAKQKLGNHQVSFEKMLKELEIEKKVFSEKNVENAKNERLLKQNLEQYTQLKEYLETQKKSILNTAKIEAKNLVKEANQKIEKTIRDIKEIKADKELTKIIREDLELFEKKELKIEIKVEKPKLAEYHLDSGELGIGSLVRVKGQETVGEIIGMRGKDAEVAIGSLKTTIKVNRLEKISRKEYKEQMAEPTPEKKIVGINLNEKMMHYSFNLDLRGKRGEVAMAEVDAFMNDTIMLGYPEIRIVHGKGDGILRTLIRNQLKTYKQVGKMVDEHADRGGAGVTIVTMK